MTDQTPSTQSVVYVEVSGLTGSGKSAIMGEIEIALKALGLTVEHDAAFQAEKNGTHADWQGALDLYKPTVVLTERNMSRAPVTNDDAPTYMRLAQALSRHPEVMVVERSDPTLELTRDGLEHLLDDVFPLAALSPEAPAREGIALDKRIADAAERDRRERDKAFRGESYEPLTPRHEAPASAIDDLVDRFAVALKEKLRAAEAKYGHDDAWMRDDWRDDLIWQLGEHVQKGDPRDVAAYCAFAWHHGWSVGPFSVSGENGEAPAEGAGERGAPLTFTPFRDELREAQAALEPFAFIAERRSLSPATAVHLVHLDGTHIETVEVNAFWRARYSLSSLRARSSAPEAPARDGSKKHLPECWGSTSFSDEVAHCYCKESPEDAGGLLPCPFCGGDAEIIHIEDGENEGGSCVCCTVCQASGNVEFGRKENFISNWNRRARSSAPEAREGEAVGVVYSLKADLNTAELPDGTLLYIHPAAPSADKLRIATDALDRIATVDMGGGFLGALACRQVANQALAALKGDAK